MVDELPPATAHSRFHRFIHIIADKVRICNDNKKTRRTKRQAFGMSGYVIPYCDK